MHALTRGSGRTRRSRRGPRPAPAEQRRGGGRVLQDEEREERRDERLGEAADRRARDAAARDAPVPEIERDQGERRRRSRRRPQCSASPARVVRVPERPTNPSATSSAIIGIARIAAIAPWPLRTAHDPSPDCCSFAEQIGISVKRSAARNAKTAARVKRICAAWSSKKISRCPRTRAPGTIQWRARIASPLRPR